jgi:hypothetical protein
MCVDELRPEMDVCNIYSLWILIVNIGDFL